MALLTNRQLLEGIRHDDSSVMAAAAKKYFPSCRKYLRMKGVRDAGTPEAYARAFAGVIAEVRAGRISELADFGSILHQAMLREVEKIREQAAGNLSGGLAVSPDVVAQCVAVLDEDIQRLLMLRFAERKSYEEIALASNFSNPVIAEFEVERAYQQLQRMVNVRFNLDAR
jgi:ATP phosphoribosyltransferase